MKPRALIRVGTSSRVFGPPLIQTPSFIMKVSVCASATGTGLDHASQFISGRLDATGPLEMGLDGVIAHGLLACPHVFTG